jgi:hypothetical protein
LLELVSESSEKRTNVRIMRDLQVSSLVISLNFPKLLCTYSYSWFPSYYISSLI